MPENSQMSKKNNDQDKKDAALWAHMMRDVKPFERALPTSVPPPSPEKHALKKKAIDPQHRPSAEPESKPPSLSKSSQDKPHPARGLDTRTLEKLRKGQIPIESRLDLHGLSQARAHAALVRFIMAAYRDEKRCVLVITGKGAGVLKAGVPLWLAEEPLHSVILKTVPAQPRHGGDGALYVYLRRAR